MDREKILQAFRGDLAATQKRHDEASKCFGDAIHDVGPKAAERVLKASREYGQAQHELLAALTRLNRYLAHGTVPAKLRKLIREKRSISKRTIS